MYPRLSSLEEAELGVEALIPFCLQEKMACLPSGCVLPRIENPCGGERSGKSSWRRRHLERVIRDGQGISKSR